MTDDEGDEALHEVGRHLGVRYDARGVALPEEPKAPMISAGESLRLLEAYVKELDRKQVALEKVRKHEQRGRVVKGPW